MSDVQETWPSPVHGLLRVRRGEGRVVALAILFHFLLFCATGVVRPVRDEIATVVQEPSWLWTGTFVTLLAVQPLVGLLVARARSRRLGIYAYLGLGASLLVFHQGWQAGGSTMQTGLGYAFYAWVSAINLFAVSVFWSQMADVFSLEQSRRLFGPMAVGASLGSIFGSAITGLFVTSLGGISMLLIAAGFFGLCAWLSALVGGHAVAGASGSPDAPLGGGILSGLKNIFRVDLLRQISLFIFLMTMASTFLYWIGNELVREYSADRDERRALFAWISFAVSIAAGLTQLFLASRIIRAVGVRWALGLLPLACVLSFVALGLYPGLVTFICAEVLCRAMRYGAAKPARESLFTLASREDKYKSKNALDTCFYRGGDVANAWFYEGLNRGLGLPLAAMAWVFVPFGLGWMLFSLRLGSRADAAAAQLRKQA